ncbi:hypothetical protein BUALT_Bualt02G0236400 [Buddleja alternifolia]|uniref:DUF538 domain-containing protein n=1 Tax=Buddleja alternifolia TaxID=168488 RepID=A0AAV6YDS7_9LAMI|nr:hypothetical protein BUALT_Bualt02G0236400 [Buddleja alternifolia]
MAWTIILSFSAFVLCVSAHYNHNKPSVYESLQKYNFPVGLLPKGATGYSLNQATGEFSAYLNGSCSFTLENSYELKYKPVIKGVISEGRLQKLSGVSVKVVVMWLNIVEVKRNNDNLEFSVGFTSAIFPVDNFEECPQCGCGLDCVGGRSSNEVEKSCHSAVAMSPLTCLLLAISVTIISASPEAVAAADSPTVYEALETYGFPVGLLPKGVTSYELDSATGKFTVHLNKSCSFTIDGYNLNYKTKISGTISTNRIKNLNGIQVKVLLFWVNIIEVTKDGDELELSVGIASADFPMDSFVESPQCGCGFDCVNGGKRSAKFGFKSLVPLLDV